MSALVELEAVSRSFGSRPVLREVSLTARSGELLALYGRSGSGKTTLLNLIGGLDRPSGGRVLVGGRELSALPAAEQDRIRRTEIGFIFQSYGLLSHLTAYENLLFALHLAGAPRLTWNERAAEALEAVGLTRRMHHRPAELSGGERQRVAVARALATRPRLLLADEPTGALDHATGLVIVDLLLRFARETGACILIATHDIAIRERVDRAYRIHDGSLAREEIA
jgi:putative ABC transport system ATP-binding protein